MSCNSDLNKIIFVRKWDEFTKNTMMYWYNQKPWRYPLNY